MQLSSYTTTSKINKEEIHFYILPGEKELVGDMTYWKVNPTEAQRLVGITMGNLPANEMTQFVSAPTNSTAKVAPESEHNGGTITKLLNQVMKAVVNVKIRGKL